MTINAYAIGGGIGSYAIWGELRAKVYDPGTQRFLAVSYPGQLGPDIFGADRIESGQMRSGTLDLECFRVNPGQDVWVQLELHYSVVNGGGAPVPEDPILVQLDCR